MPDLDRTAEQLTDAALQSEIELVGDLVVAATSSSGPLPQDQIDRLLGIDPGPGEGNPQCAAEPTAVSGT